MKRQLGVGINKFADPSSNLSGCVNDTANIRQFCVDEGWDPAAIRILCDERATRLNIFERLAWCTKNWPDKPIPAQDQLVIQFSCHGSQVVCRNGDEVDDKKDEVLCPYDYPYLWDSPKDAPDTEACAEYLGYEPAPLICDDDLAVFLKKIPTGVYTVLIVDACHSGSIDRDLRSPVKTMRTAPRFVPAPFDIRARGMNRTIGTRKFGVKPGTVVKSLGNPNVHYVAQNHILLSGCRDDQTSADATIEGQACGAMTWAFLEAESQVDRKATWLDIHARMLELLKSGGYTQVPQLTGPEEWLKAPIFFRG